MALTVLQYSPVQASPVPTPWVKSAIALSLLPLVSDLSQEMY
ncbi:uncharacterized protein G2W53_041243 [Senna tora]|uniref:Uncharacterized protein n=1 Tax=Senna tora TaxID=362788 RepID=A0A834VYJ0_9FABA|nr:uncharacterized protein G2W53_041243 [Senna tora]